MPSSSLAPQPSHRSCRSPESAPASPTLMAHPFSHSAVTNQPGAAASSILPILETLPLRAPFVQSRRPPTTAKNLHLNIMPKSRHLDRSAAELRNPRIFVTPTTLQSKPSPAPAPPPNPSTTSPPINKPSISASENGEEQSPKNSTSLSSSSSPPTPSAVSSSLARN